MSSAPRAARAQLSLAHQPTAARKAPTEAGLCGPCHGVEGKAPIISTYPKLAGQNKDYLIQQFKDIRSGARSNAQTSAMKGIVQGVSDADIAAIAEYLSKL